MLLEREDFSMSSGNGRNGSGNGQRKPVVQRKRHTRRPHAGIQRLKGEVIPATRTKLTPEVQESICGIISMGNYIETAAIFSGVTRRTIQNWREWGDNPRGPEDEIYVNFKHALDEAMAKAEMLDLERIRIASENPQFWTAAAWRLERRYPDKWATKREPIEANVTLCIKPPPDLNIPIAHRVITDKTDRDNGS